MTDQKLPGYRFPLSVMGHAVWLYHRYALSYRDVDELLFERGIEVSCESIRTWCINFSDEFAQNLRHREPRRGSRWHLDEMHVVICGVAHWLWRAVNEHGVVLDVFLQRHRDTSATTSFFQRLLGEYHVPETVCTDKLASYGAAIRELPTLDDVDHQQVISSARCNNLIEQSHRRTRRQERAQLGFRQVRRTQGFLDLHARITNLHGSTRSTIPANDRRFFLRTALRSWRAVVQQVA
ncbi:IS6 family transposase [Deinococcus psychrotolerans]|uniref:IS6 family transposase n=1 Tax=Deinococcus psychrotolerans TaxID=2489213 RepID=A0A3G8YP78_9DEIO|nr:IS6 family transposase [Deinococcus psychrotolerans]AZI44434.1 IS6 family transposase [Deinococcus psychrotolerans]